MTSPSALLYDMYYHIYNRSVNRANIFIEEQNYEHFLKLYEKHLAPVTDLFAYCLLRNHFHILVRVKSNDENVKIPKVSKTIRVHPPIWMLLAFLLAGCVGGLPASQDPATQTPILPTRTLTSTPISTVTLTPTTAPTPEPTPTPEPPGCLEPPDDYSLVEVNGETLNTRTYAMLEHAQELYGGELEIAGHAVTQGSYTEGESASLGTHAGGGAVDLSVLRRGTYTVLWEDVEPVLHALRAAGFAAWLREYGELYEGSPIHIHAIAIGDRELSPAAEAQLTGEAGYFRGFSGLPVDADGLPTPDRYGGPLLCGWMIELGYQDLR